MTTGCQPLEKARSEKASACSASRVGVKGTRCAFVPRRTRLPSTLAIIAREWGTSGVTAPRQEEARQQPKGDRREIRKAEDTRGMANQKVEDLAEEHTGKEEAKEESMVDSENQVVEKEKVEDTGKDRYSR